MPSSTNPPSVPNMTSHYWPRDPSRFVLDNGLEVLVAQRAGSPVVELRFEIVGVPFAPSPVKRTTTESCSSVKSADRIASWALFTVGLLGRLTDRFSQFQDDLGFDRCRRWW